MKYDEEIKQLKQYDPPDDESMKEAYYQGFVAAQQGKKKSCNPYKPSGHERDTTFEDELYYYWYSGHCDRMGPAINGVNADPEERAESPYLTR